MGRAQCCELKWKRLPELVPMFVGSEELQGGLLQKKKRRRRREERRRKSNHK